MSNLLEQLASRVRNLETDEPPVVYNLAAAAVTTPPTQLELNAAFGATAAQLRDGWAGVIYDVGAGNVWLAVSSADLWWVIGGGGGAGVPHNLLSATHPDTDPAAPVSGDIVRASDDLVSLWERYPIGVHWQLLGVNAGQTLPEWQSFDWDLHVIAAGGDGVHDHSGDPEGGLIPVGSITPAVPSGTGGANRGTWWNGVNTITSTATWTYDGTNMVLSSGTFSCPGAGVGSERIGALSVAAGLRAIAIGRSASAGGQDAIAIGEGTSAPNTQNIVIGRGATAANVSDVAIGVGATASGGSSYALGAAAVAAFGSIAIVGQGNGATCIGIGTSAVAGSGTRPNAIAIGRTAVAVSSQSIAIGYQATINGAYTDSIAIGTTATVTGVYGIALGRVSVGANVCGIGGEFGSGYAVDVGSGTATPACKLDLWKQTATTNAVLEMIRITGVVTGVGVAAAGFGPGFSFYGESATDGSYRPMGQVATIWTTATDLTRASAMLFMLPAVGTSTLTEYARLIPLNFIVKSDTLLNGFIVHDTNAGYTNVFTGLAAPRNDVDWCGGMSPLTSAAGGVAFQGASDSDSIGVSVSGIIGSNTPTVPTVTIRADKFDGVNSTTALAATEIIAAFKDAATEVWRIYGDGDVLMVGAAVLNLRDTAIGAYSQADTFLDLFADGAVRIGNSSAGAPTTYIAVEPGADTFWVGAGSGLPYGSCSGNDIAWSQANAVQNTWYNISDADMIDGVLNLVTHDGSGKLTVLKAGTYLMTYGITIESSVANDHIEVGIEISSSGSAVAGGQAHYENKFANEEESVAGTATLLLAANDTIEVCIRTTDANTPDLSAQNLNISVVQVGGGA